MVTDGCVNNVEHVFEDTSKIIPVVFATDKNFIPYLYVAIQSLVDNSSDSNNYDIVILCTDVEEYKQKQFKQLEKSNISIRFFDMAELMSEYQDVWYTHWQYTNSVYYRFFIPQIFSAYNKIIFLDADIAINCDVAELYNTDLEGKSIGASIGLARQKSDDWHREYIENTLKLDCKDYFNAGIFVLNIDTINKETYLKDCIQILNSLNNPPMQDQDVMNVYFKKNVKYISCAYNLTWNCIHYWENFAEMLPQEIASDYKKACECPKIIHYAGKYKPWKHPHLIYSEYFWKYARKTPYYEEILYKYAMPDISRKTIYNAIYRKRIYLKYLRCKLLKIFTFGKKREHYSSKMAYLKTKINDYRKTLQR